MLITIDKLIKPKIVIQIFICTPIWSLGFYQFFIKWHWLYQILFMFSVAGLANSIWAIHVMMCGSDVTGYFLCQSWYEIAAANRKKQRYFFRTLCQFLRYYSPFTAYFINAILWQWLWRWATDTVAARKIIMKVVISDGIEYALNLNYRTIDIESTDYTNIAAIVVTMLICRVCIKILKIWDLLFRYLWRLNMVM